MNTTEAIAAAKKIREELAASDPGLHEHGNFEAVFEASVRIYCAGLIDNALDIVNDYLRDVENAVTSGFRNS